MKLTKFNSLPGDTPIEKLERWANDRWIYGQVKYNGVFCHWSSLEQTFTTRQGKRWDARRFPALLLNTCRHNKYDLYGELIVPGIPLSEIAGAVNVNSDKPFPPNTSLLVFDAFDPLLPTLVQPFCTRLEYKISGSSWCNRVHTSILGPYKAEEMFQSATALGSEGIVYRRNPCYLIESAGPHPDIVKRKRIHAAEGICIAVIEGKGKRRGMLGAMILQLDNGKPLKVGGGAGLTDDLLAKLYANPPLNKSVTFSYEELAASGIPLRPQFVSVRDYE